MEQNDVMGVLRTEGSSSGNLILEFLKENGILGMEKDEQLTETVRLVAEIPWGEGRTIGDVLATKKVGTCTGKHLVLQACLDQLGIRYIPVVCTFRWSEQGLMLPDSLKSILAQGEWDHGHNFVQVERDDGTKVDVDLTWNSRLRDVGFITVPADWDGKTSIIAVKMKERWDNTDMKQMKVKLIESLSPELRERREHFLEGFIAWIGSINK